MKKKILSMMLVAAMTVGTLAGCGSNSGNGNSEKEQIRQQMQEKRLLSSLCICR